MEQLGTGGASAPVLRSTSSARKRGTGNLSTLIARVGKPAQSYDGSTRLCHTRLFSSPCCRGTMWLRGSGSASLGEKKTVSRRITVEIFFKLCFSFPQSDQTEASLTCPTICKEWEKLKNQTTSSDIRVRHLAVPQRCTDVNVLLLSYCHHNCSVAEPWAPMLPHRQHCRCAPAPFLCLHPTNDPAEGIVNQQRSLS